MQLDPMPACSLRCSSSISIGAFVKTWLPFVLLLGIILTVILVFNLR